MRLRVDQLPAHLQRSGAAPVYLLSGDEPLQMLEATDLIRDHTRKSGADRAVLTVDKNFDWNQLEEESANLSLFSNRRLIELRLGSGSPGKPGAEALVKYAQSPSPDNTLLVSMGKLDKRSQQSRWFKALEKSGVIVQIWPVEPSRLPGWIIQRVRQAGREIDKAAAELIAQRTEGNLLSAKQELDKLCLLVDRKEITLDDALAAVTDSARYEVFALIESALLGHTPRIVSMLRGLRQEGVEPIGLNGAIMWELRRLCSVSAQISSGTPKDKVYAEYRIWEKHQAALDSVLKRLSSARLNTLLVQAVVTDKALKGAIRQSPWELLENMLFCLSGKRLHL